MKLLWSLVLVNFFAEAVPDFYVCGTNTPTYADCQATCDASTDCGAWTWTEETKKCNLKTRHGFTIVDYPGKHSGFRDSGPFVEANTMFHGADLPCGA